MGVVAAALVLTTMSAAVRAGDFTRFVSGTWMKSS